MLHRVAFMKFASVDGFVTYSIPSLDSQGLMPLGLLAVSPCNTVEFGQRLLMAGMLSATSLPPLVQKGITVFPERS